MRASELISMLADHIYERGDSVVTVQMGSDKYEIGNLGSTSIDESVCVSKTSITLFTGDEV